MSNITEIKFETISEFKKFCKTNNIKPEIQFKSKKHQNRKCEFLHEIFGSFNFANINFSFNIEEMPAFAEKKNPIEGGYLLKEL